MKRPFAKFLSFLIILLFGCNSPKVENDQADEPLEMDTTQVLQTEVPVAIKKGIAIPQTQIIMDEAIVIASDFIII